jgi:serine/threonine protein phosphatase PrpC
MAENNSPQMKWRMIGKTVRGASHVRAELPNQDAIYWEQSAKTASFILAVSDGHGSNKCFRSHIGSNLAVHTAARVLRDLVDGQPDLGNLTAVKRMAEERLPQTLVRQWKSVVEEHLTQNAFTEQEWSRLAEKEGEKSRQLVEANPLLAYGATLITALLTEHFVLYLQLGDGEILSVSGSGEVSRPMPADERLIANETTSLCGPDSWRDFRLALQTLSTTPPALVFLSTDGYPNSFRDDEGFFKVATDLLDMIRSDGIEKVDSNLEGWLSEASRAGSGDDITVGIIKRVEDRDIDTIHERIVDCEVKVRDNEQQRTRIDDQQKRLEGVENNLNDLKDQLQNTFDRMLKLRWGFVVACVLAVVGIVLALAPWFRPSGALSRVEAPALRAAEVQKLVRSANEPAFEG